MNDDEPQFVPAHLVTVRSILTLMTPAQRAEAAQVARAKGVSVEMVVRRAADALFLRSEREEITSDEWLRAALSSLRETEH